MNGCKNTAPARFSSTVSIYRDMGENDNLECVIKRDYIQGLGVLIEEHWALSAAHCFSNSNKFSVATFDGCKNRAEIKNIYWPSGHHSRRGERILPNFSGIGEHDELVLLELDAKPQRTDNRYFPAFLGPIADGYKSNFILATINDRSASHEIMTRYIRLKYIMRTPSRILAAKCADGPCNGKPKRDDSGGGWYADIDGQILVGIFQGRIKTQDEQHRLYSAIRIRECDVEWILKTMESRNTGGALCATEPNN